MTEDEASALGTSQGVQAAQWAFDGNTPEETYRAYLTAFEDGDPLVLGELMERFQPPYGPASEELIGHYHTYADAFFLSLETQIERLAREHLG